MSKRAPLKNLSIPPFGIHVIKGAGRKLIEAEEKAAVDIVRLIRDRVLRRENAKEGIQSFIERSEAVFEGRQHSSGGCRV